MKKTIAEIMQEASDDKEHKMFREVAQKANEAQRELVKKKYETKE